MTLEPGGREVASPSTAAHNALLVAHELEHDSARRRAQLTALAYYAAMELDVFLAARHTEGLR